MFAEISPAMQERMAYLEGIDGRDRGDGTARLSRLRQIPPETGRFLAILAAGCPEGEFVEIGTSAGYSALWISLALQGRSVRLKTCELLEEKIRLAKETFRLAGIADSVELLEGDALGYIKDFHDIAFCFLDCEKELYESCWDLLAERMVRGGLLVADNAINHIETLRPMVDKALGDSRFDSLVVPIGKGELVCRRK